MTTPSTAGLSWLHSPSFLVTEMKSGAKNTPPTPGSSISALASGEASASAASRASKVPDSSTGRPGRNLSVVGLGVASVWMNTAGSLKMRSAAREIGARRGRAQASARDHAPQDPNRDFPGRSVGLDRIASTRGSPWPKLSASKRPRRARGDERRLPAGRGRAHRSRPAAAFRLRRRVLRRLRRRHARFGADRQRRPSHRPLVQAASAARPSVARAGGAQRDRRARRRQGPRHAEPARGADRALRGAEGVEPERLAVARMGRAVARRPVRRLHAGRLLLQDLHAAAGRLGEALRAGDPLGGRPRRRAQGRPIPTTTRSNTPIATSR